MIQRIVCFKFKSGVSQTAVEKHMADFAGLEGAIEQIKHYSAGPVINKESPEYDSVHYLRFESTDAIDIYYHHDAHQRFISENRESWESVLVLDSAIEG